MGAGEQVGSEEKPLREAEDVRQVLPEDPRQLPACGREGLGHLRLLVRGVRAAGAGGATEETETSKESEREEGEEQDPDGEGRQALGEAS